MSVSQKTYESIQKQIKELLSPHMGQIEDYLLNFDNDDIFTIGYLAGTKKDTSNILGFMRTIYNIKINDDQADSKQIQSFLIQQSAQNQKIQNNDSPVQQVLDKPSLGKQETIDLEEIGNKTPDLDEIKSAQKEIDRQKFPLRRVDTDVIQDDDDKQDEKKNNQESQRQPPPSPELAPRQIGSSNNNKFNNYKVDEGLDEATQLLIQQMQQEDENQRIKRQKDAEQYEETCPICYSNLAQGNPIPLDTCQHIFHEQCLVQHITQSVKKQAHIGRKVNIGCPGQDCKSEINVEDFQKYLKRETFDKYQAFALESYVEEHSEQVSWCPTADCRFVFVLSDIGEDNNFSCLLCKQHYCLNCRAIFHTGQSCKQYQVSQTRDDNDVKFEQFIKGKQFKQCSKCKFWVEKNMGCDHMTCRCKYQFCYRCGGKYMDCQCTKSNEKGIKQKFIFKIINQIKEAREDMQRRQRQLQLRREKKSSSQVSSRRGKQR